MNISPLMVLPLVVIYFFFNAVGLPAGLTYTILLSPLFIFWNIRAKLFAPYLGFALLSSVFLAVHTWYGMETGAYLKSLALVFSSFVFVLAAIQFTRIKDGLSFSMKSVLIINALLLPVAAAFLFSPWKELFWYLVPISPGLPEIPRLKMLTYEASYYSLLLVPVFLYYMLKVVFIKGYNAFLISVLLILPLILSFSLGVIGGLVISLVILYLTHVKWLVLHPRFRSTFIVLSLLSLGTLALLYFIFPENPLFVRLANIPDGTDTSARGRTYEAIELAWLMAQEKSVWFGIGPGQIKTLGRDIIIQYYQYLQIPEVVRLPNAIAETLAQFGIIGLSLRLGAQIWLFFKTRVYQNFFRLALFLFVFIYQFTGSYLTNSAELILWVLCFTPIVPELNKSTLLEELHIPGKKGGDNDQ